MNNGSMDDPDIAESFRKNRAIETYNSEGAALIQAQDAAARMGLPQPSGDFVTRATTPVDQVPDR
jgi:hypothetical protein